MQPRESGNRQSAPAPRREGIASLLLFTAITLISCSADPVKSAADLRAGELSRDLNLLVVTLDTTRADRIGCYGYAPAETPRIDALARNGVRFDNAIASAPMTLPAHASLFTGTYPTHHGVRDNGRVRVSDGLTTLAEIFAQQGFATGAFVGAFVLDGRFGLDQGFDTYDDDLGTGAAGTSSFGKERAGDVVVERATEWLRDVPADTRFFCWVHLFDPHSLHRPPPAFAARHAGRPYDGEIAFSDQNLGRLLDVLAELGVEERTLVVFVSDHGEAFGEHGEHGHAFFVYDTTLRVPLVMSWPAALPAGVVVERPVSLIDVAPTLLDVFGFDVPAACQGRSLLDLCFAPNVGADRPIYAESLHGTLRFGWAPLQALRTERWKYIRAPRPELYDLLADPAETANVIDAQPQVAERLADALDALLRSSTAAAPTPEHVKLGAAETEALEELGYLGGETLSGGDATGADPKDRVASIVAYQRAKDLMGAGRTAEAVPVLEGLARESPASAEIHGRLGLAHARLQQWEPAEASLDLARRLDPTSGETLVNLAGVHMARDELDLARPILEEALRLDADDPMALLNLGSLCFRQQRHAEGITHHRRFLELAPDDPRAPKVRQGVEQVETALKR